MIVVVNSVECNLQIHSITLAPSTWCLACNCSAVDVDCWHNLGLGLNRGWGELAVKFLGTIRDVCEFSAQEVDVSATAWITTIWEYIIKDWLFVVLEFQSRVSPVNSIGAHLKWEHSVDVIIRRSNTYKSNIWVEFSTHDLVSKLAVRNEAVFWHVPEIPAYNFYRSSTLAQASSWPNRDERLLLVLIEFNIWWQIVVVKEWCSCRVSF